MFDFEVRASAEGKAGPARTQEEADADQLAGLDMIEAKHKRLDELQAEYELKGHTPARARAYAASAYAAEQGGS